MNEAKNLKEFIALIKRYETITLEEIERGDADAMYLTNFGSLATCTLCLAANGYTNSFINCYGCLYTIVTASRTNFVCMVDITYDGIREANDLRDADKLLTAYRARADYMREILKKYYDIIALESYNSYFEKQKEEKIENS